MLTKPAPRRFRFSLQTLVSAVTIVAMAIVIGLLYTELVPLREENARLRDEVGELTIEDDSKFHAILTPQSNHSELTYKWRIWIPLGKSYQLRYESRAIPKQGFPSGHGTIAIMEPGEQWIEYCIFRDADSGKWHDMLQTRQVSVSGTFQDWPDWPSRMGGGTAVGDTTRVFDPDQRIELARWHVSQAKSSAQIEDPSAGYMIWLDPAP